MLIELWGCITGKVALSVSIFCSFSSNRVSNFAPRLLCDHSGKRKTTPTASATAALTPEIRVSSDYYHIPPSLSLFLALNPSPPSLCPSCPQPFPSLPPSLSCPQPLPSLPPSLFLAVDSSPPSLSLSCPRLSLPPSLFLALDSSPPSLSLSCPRPVPPSLPPSPQPITIAELFMPSHKLLRIFAPLGHHKNSILDAATVREVVTVYVKTNELAGARWDDAHLMCTHACMQKRSGVQCPLPALGIYMYAYM